MNDKLRVLNKREKHLFGVKKSIWLSTKLPKLLKYCLDEGSSTQIEDDEPVHSNNSNIPTTSSSTQEVFQESQIGQTSNAIGDDIPSSSQGLPTYIPFVRY